MKTEHLRQSFNLLGYDVNEIRVIQPNRTANPSQYRIAGNETKLVNNRVCTFC